jgi:hypothetical protein
MQYYQHSRQIKSSKPRGDVRQVGPEDAPPPEERRELKRPGKPLPSCLQRSGKGPLKVRFEEVRIPDSDEEAVIGWAEDEYVLSLKI